MEQASAPSRTELLSYWIIATWFQDVLRVLPCLVITGPMHSAMLVLDCLQDCCVSVRLAGFRRSDLGVRKRGCATFLLSEPHLDKRTAAFLSNLTNPKCEVVEGGYLSGYATPTAFYVGEHPGAHKILHSVQVHITPTLIEAARRPEWLQKHIERLPEHLKQYREANLDEVRHSQFVADGLTLEAAAIASALGSCIVDEPELRNRSSSVERAE